MHKRSLSQNLVDTAALAAGHALDNLSDWLDRPDKQRLERTPSTRLTHPTTTAPVEVRQLKEGLREIYKDHFEIVEVKVGFRPTVKDRRPILGRHATEENYYIFNGLGARGILNGSYFSAQLYHFIEDGKALNDEVSLERFS